MLTFGTPCSTCKSCTHCVLK